MSMKRTAAALAAATALAASGAIYPQAMKVTAVDANSDTVTLETSTGHVYEMHGAEDWMAGDIAAVIMFTNGTPVVTDDAVICARFSGFTMNEEVK